LERKERNMEGRERNIEKSIYVTRFNDETYKQYVEYCKKYEDIKCIYNAPVKFNDKTRENDNIYVLEMNNSLNKIMGIGRISRRMYSRKHKMYQDMNYNRYSYEGKQHKHVDNFPDNLREKIEKIEKVIFYTKGHIKRGHGIQCLPLNAYRVCKNNDEREDLTLYDVINNYFAIDTTSS